MKRESMQSALDWFREKPGRVTALRIADKCCVGAAVAAFLRDEIPFGGIARVVEAVLVRTPNRNVSCVEDVYEADRAARAAAQQILKQTKIPNF